MKRLLKKTKGLVRGAPTAVLVSAAIHAGLLLLLGGLVVFHIVIKPESKFVPPPPVDRPKMELIKPKVKVKKTVKPGASQRIVSKAIANMPDMQLPALAGMGKGLGGGIGGFDLMPDISQMSLFGGTKSVAIGNDFEGRFYSAAYDRSMKKSNVGSDSFVNNIRRFMELDWNPMVFAPYYRAPQKLYATHFFIPSMNSEFGPSYFGMPSGPDFDPYLWCAHYKGKIANKKGGRFRFWGISDDLLLVRVNGTLVLNASWGGNRSGYFPEWERQEEDFKYNMGFGSAAIGLWFELEPGVPVEMQVLIGEIPGGNFCARLVVEKEGEDYPKNRDGMPVLPVFKTAKIPDVVKDKIKYELIVGEADLDSDLMFNVY